MTASIRIGQDGTYWVAAHYQTPDGADLYSPSPISILVAGAVLVDNVLLSWDEAALGWPGTLTAAAVVVGANLTLAATGDVLGIVDFLAAPDLLWFGGVAPSGYYTIPAGHQIDCGRVMTCGLQLRYSVAGVSIYDNILAIDDFLGIGDLLGAALGPLVRVTPQIQIAQADHVFAAWQDFIPGQYTGRYFNARWKIESLDPQVSTVISAAVFVVDVPDRIDAYTNQALAAGGTTLIFADPFNGGPGAANLPNIQCTIIGATAGDDLLLTGVTLAQATLQIVNGGVGVARNANILVQGY